MKMLYYVMDRLKNKSHYSNNDYKTLSDSLAMSVRRNLNWDDSVSVSYIKPMLQVVIDSSSSYEIKKEYLELIDSLPE